jgi:ATP-binding cassette, subfamily B, bacterial PglK
MSLFDKIFIIIGKFKFDTFSIFFLSIISVLLEVFGVGIIFPAITIITGNEINFLNFDLKYYVSEISLFYNLRDEIIVLIILTIFFFLKFCYMVFFIWYQARFTAKITTAISRNLFSKYIHSEYSFYFKKDTSELIRNVLGEANNFLKKVFTPCLQILMDCLILSGILFLIFIIDFKSSSILFLIYGGFGIFYFSIFKKKLYYIGKQQLFYDQLKIKTAQEAFFGIKTIKIFLKEVGIVQNFANLYKKVANLSKLQTIILQIPKYAIELITIITFLVICLSLMNKTNDFNKIIPTLTLFVTAAFRIIPTINRLINNNQILRGGYASLENLVNEIKNLDTVIHQKLETKEIASFKNIKIKNLSFCYQNNENILDEINLDIKKGEKIGLIGKTGSGKTTLVDLILGLIKPSKGEIKIDDRNINTFDSSWKNIIGYVPQETFLLDDTIRNNIIFDNKVIVDEKALNLAIQYSEVDEFLKDNKDLNLIIGERGITLSGGQKQRIGIARALYKKTQIIIFDESTSSLDIKTEKKIMDSIYNLDKTKTLIIISHRDSLLLKCDKIFEIKNKKLIQIK